eukprot:scaffold706_cov418-Prasinococcus_capsulatus_cf.AAC.3
MERHKCACLLPLIVGWVCAPSQGPGWWKRRRGKHEVLLQGGEAEGEWPATPRDRVLLGSSMKSGAHKIARLAARYEAT